MQGGSKGGGGGGGEHENVFSSMREPWKTVALMEGCKNVCHLGTFQPTSPQS